MYFDSATAVAWITRAFDLIRADEARLTSLDAAIGDGDHGANMLRGLTEAVTALKNNEPESAGRVLITTGRGLVSKTGGAAGPLYGTGFRQAGKSLGEGGDVVAVGEALGEMLTGIQELGGATQGDKTMVDALAPAVIAFQEAASVGSDLHTAATAAADAAADGLAATIPLQARKGRASYLGTRSVGHEDPGAASTALILQALAEVTST